MLNVPGHKFDVTDFARMQQDTVSLTARDFQAILKTWQPTAGSDAEKIRSEILTWDCDMASSSRPALIYEVWTEHLHSAILPKGIASTRLAPEILLSELKSTPNRNVWTSLSCGRISSWQLFREINGQIRFKGHVTEMAWRVEFNIKLHHRTRPAAAVEKIAAEVVSLDAGSA